MHLSVCLPQDIRHIRYDRFDRKVEFDASIDPNNDFLRSLSFLIHCSLSLLSLSAYPSPFPPLQRRCLLLSFKLLLIHNYSVVPMHHPSSGLWVSAAHSSLQVSCCRSRHTHTCRRRIIASIANIALHMFHAQCRRRRTLQELLHTRRQKDVCEWCVSRAVAATTSSLLLLID